jgi:hypothetical protein
MEIPVRDPALDQLDVFVGEWDTEAAHPKLDGTVHGRTTFQWLTGRSFLIQRSESPPNTVPSSIAVIGGGDTPGIWPMHYFDSRGIMRVYQLSFHDRILKIWRDHPGFLQRSVGVFEDGERTLRLTWELAEDHGPWKRDLEMTFRRR